jgi:hypothetical protein
MMKNSLRPHLFNHDTESISKILDELLFGLLKKFERVGQPVVDETLMCPVGWVNHLVTNSGVRMKSIDTMILILSVPKHLALSYKLFLLAACFYAKNVVRTTGFGLVHRSNIF